MTAAWRHPLRRFQMWRAYRESLWQQAYRKAQAEGRCTCVADGFAGFDQDPDCVVHGVASSSVLVAEGRSMRDPARIDPFLEKLAQLWKRHPDQRFGQLVMNLTRDKKGNFMDPWEWEEDVWEMKIKSWEEELLSDEEIMARVKEILEIIEEEE